MRSWGLLRLDYIIKPSNRTIRIKTAKNQGLREVRVEFSISSGNGVNIIHLKAVCGVGAGLFNLSALFKAVGEPAPTVC